MLLSFMLVDAADPRYGGAPDPDDERRRRWQPVDRRVLLPFVGSFSCLAVSGVTEPAVTLGLVGAAVGFLYMGARAAASAGDAGEGASRGL